MQSIEAAKTELLEACNQDFRISVDKYRAIAESVKQDQRPELLEFMTNNGLDFCVQALYHHAPGRQYKPTRRELDSGKFECPRCHVILIRITLKAKDPIYRCPDCAWAINRSDIFDPQIGEEPVLRTDVGYDQGIAPPPDEEPGPW